MSESVQENKVTSGEQSSEKPPDIFISYRHGEDGEGIDLALGVFYWFRAQGISCFLDVVGLGPGEYKKELFSKIERSKYFLVLLADGVVKSSWVSAEIDYACDKLEARRIIPVTIDKEYEEDPRLSRLEGLQGFSVYRKKFDSSLRDVVERGMPEFKDLLTSHEHGVDRLLSSIRWYKRNDGEIREDEKKRIYDAAEALRISKVVCDSLINQVEEAWEKEQQFTKAYILPRYKHENRIDLEEHGDLQKEADKHDISQDRLNELILAVNAEEAGKREKAGKRKLLWWISAVCAACLAASIWFVAWWYGRDVGTVEAQGRNAKIIAQLKADIKKESQKVDLAEASKEKAIKEAQALKSENEKLTEELKAVRRQK